MHLFAVAKGPTGNVPKDRAEAGDPLDRVGVMGREDGSAEGVLEIEFAVPRGTLAGVRQWHPWGLVEQRLAEKVIALYPVLS
jgi:hypothetical protein